MPIRIASVRECNRCHKEKASNKFRPGATICDECTRPFTVESIKDFQTCSLLYSYRNIQDEYEGITKREILDLRFENTIKKIASFYFYKRQAGIIPSWSALLNRWERLWFPKDTTAWDIISDTHETTNGNIASYSTDATAALMRFHEFFGDDKSDPLLIDEPYLVPLGINNMRLEGSFDLVLRNAKTKQYKVIKWHARHQRANASSFLMDFAALKHAFEHRNGNQPANVLYGSYDLTIAGREGIKQFDITDAEVNSLKYWAKEAWDATTFAPRRGLTNYCKRCPFDAKCSKFVITNEMLGEQ